VEEVLFDIMGWFSMENKFTDRIASNRKLSSLFRNFFNKISNEYPHLKTSNTKYYFSFKGEDNKNKIWFSRQRDHLLVKVRRNAEMKSEPRTFTISDVEQINNIWNKIKLDDELKIVSKEEEATKIFSKELGEMVSGLKINYILKMLLIDSRGLDCLIDKNSQKLMKEYFIEGKRIETIEVSGLEDNFKLDVMKQGLNELANLRSVSFELIEIKELLDKYPHAKTSSLLDLIYGENLFSEIDSRIYAQVIKAVFKLRGWEIKGK
jgi:hypothetical protein